VLAPAERESHRGSVWRNGDRYRGEPLELGINGVAYSASQPIMAHVGDTQVWEITNTIQFAHPFHLHGFFFQVLSPAGPLEWKHTVNVPVNATVQSSRFGHHDADEALAHRHSRPRHTDNRAAPAATRKLSAERARAVSKALVQSGVNPERLAAEGYGAQHPVCPANDSEVCHARNRRIAALVTAK
jgi:hypothetical protein